MSKHIYNNSSKKLSLSVIIPVYNEADILEKNTKKIQKAIEKITKNYELIFAEDGSTDGTDKLAKKLSSKCRNIQHIHFEKRQGKGQALSNAFKKSKGDILVFMDIDLATDLTHVSDLVNAIKNGADIAIGSRGIKSLERSLKRNIVSYCYNRCVRFLFNIDIRDAQCGFKALNRGKLLTVLPHIKDKEWFWDTELLIKAHKRKYKIVEIPIKWKETNLRKSKVNVFKDGMKMGLKLIKLKMGL
ncbi:MAG: glycosyltransferase family 2 protein [Candidatus Aenigmarchaeota archaeon]|nr:glycosyltransferase family 2 protein [Candidatus Aenigmarchaeota archaeon]